MIVRDKVCVFVGPLGTDPLIAIGNVPAVALAIVLTVSVTATGLLEVGFTEADGVKVATTLPGGQIPAGQIYRAIGMILAPSPGTMPLSRSVLEVDQP